ncbi:MAG: cysteine--tRNA ligase [Pseudomonadota bacterium]
MSLRLTNTLTRTKEAFRPIDPNHVRFYVCGPTVWDYAHIGNARPVVVFDVLYRLLRHRYPRVTYVRNITDIDDKILNRAKETGEAIEAITEPLAQIYHDDMAALGALDPDVTPRATAHVPQMVALIERLIERGHAYEAEGHVLFNVPSMPTYGRLSRRNRDELIAGARVDVAPYKKDPADFVLWKPSEADQPGWDSPWGRGRPGWHIECSAMAAEHLGEVFDIHGGGVDLVFPHHENEIAQSTCGHGTDLMANIWMHNGFLLVEGEKMSKSLGNYYTVHELLEEFPGEALRLSLLSAHYHQPTDFTKDGVRAAKARLDRWYEAMRRLEGVEPADGGDDPLAQEFHAALDDDLNTPLALSVIDRTVAEVFDGGDPARLQGLLNLMGGIVGHLEATPESWFQGETDASDAAEIETLIADRQAARTARDFARADEIRDRLAARGIVLEDGAGGTVWKRAG